MTTDGPHTRPLRAVNDPTQHHMQPPSHPADEPPYDAPPPEDTYQLPPRRVRQDIAAERALITAALHHPNPHDIADLVRPGDFFQPVHETIWTTWHHLVAAADTRPDVVLLSSALARQGDTSAVHALADLITGDALPPLAPHYAQIVRDCSRLRTVDNIGTRLRQLATNGSPDTVEAVMNEAFDTLEGALTHWGPDAGSPAADSGLVDLSWVNGGEPPHVDPPTICRRTDGTALFYAGKVNGIFGDPESGKTWLAQAAIVEALNAGGTAAMVDVDHNGANHTAARLYLLGARLDVIADPTRFRYYGPEDGDALRAAVDDIVHRAPDIVLIDSLGEVFPMLGAKSNDDGEVTEVMRLVCTRPANAGSCVITIDHLPKSAEARSSGFAFGSMAKKRMIRGAYLRAEARVQPAPGQVGRVTLRIEKDTAGELRKASGGGYAGTLTLDSSQSETHGHTTWSIGREEAPKNDDGTFRPTKLMEAVSRYVEDNDQASTKDIETAGLGKATYVRSALKILVHEGFISTLPGPRNARLHHSIALYREAEDDNA